MKSCSKRTSSPHISCLHLTSTSPNSTLMPITSNPNSPTWNSSISNHCWRSWRIISKWSLMCWRRSIGNRWSRWWRRSAVRGRPLWLKTKRKSCNKSKQRTSRCCRSQWPNCSGSSLNRKRRSNCCLRNWRSYQNRTKLWN